MHFYGSSICSNEEEVKNARNEHNTPKNLSGSNSSPPISKKDFATTLLLCFFLGQLGAHRFYADKPITGILMLCTFGGLGIWSLIDFVMIVLGSFEDGEGLPIKQKN